MDNAAQGKTAAPKPEATSCKNEECWLDAPEPTSVCRLCKTDKKTPVLPAVRA